MSEEKSEPKDDAHIIRSAWRDTTVTIGGKEMTIKIPEGYRLLPVTHLQKLEEDMRRVRDEARIDQAAHFFRFKERIDREAALTDTITRQTRTLAKMRDRLNSAINERDQYKSLIRRPFKWFYHTLLNRAISLEERERAKKMAEDINLAAEHINRETRREAPQAQVREAYNNPIQAS